MFEFAARFRNFPINTRSCDFLAQKLILQILEKWNEYFASNVPLNNKGFE